MDEQPIAASRVPDAGAAHRGTAITITERLANPTLGVIVSSLVIGLLVGGLGALTVLGGQTTYRSQAVLLIDQPRAIAASNNAGVLQKLAQLRGKYAPLVPTQPVIERAAAASDMSAAQLRGHLAATAPPETLTIVVSGTAHHRTEAIAVARAGAAGLLRFARDEQTQARIPSAQQFEFKVVAPAQAATRTQPTGQRALAVAVTAAVLAALASYLGLTVLVSRRRT